MVRLLSWDLRSLDARSRSHLRRRSHRVRPGAVIPPTGWGGDL